MRYTATAEHTQGQSVGHCCTNGVYSDPCDGFTCEVEAANDEEALFAAEAKLRAEVGEADQCQCRRRLRPGSDRWWESVFVHVEPLPNP